MGWEVRDILEMRTDSDELCNWIANKLDVTTLHMTLRR